MKECHASPLILSESPRLRGCLNCRFFGPIASSSIPAFFDARENLRSLTKIGELLPTESLLFNGIWLESELPLIARKGRRCVICQEIEQRWR
jgi:hypothetical protein